VSQAKTLLSGAAWMYGAQLLTVVLQFLYAAATSRIIDAVGFGSYAISLSVSGLLSLLAIGGLAQAVARMDVLAPERLQGLVTYATVLGIAAASIMWFTAPLWGILWGDDGAISIVRWLAISTGTAPLAAIGGGLLRRQARFKELAILVLGSNIGGMVLGVAAVVAFRTPDALVVSPIAAQSGLLIGSLAISGRSLFGFARINRKSADIAYVAQLVPSRFAEYLVGNITRFSTSRWVGVDALGFWNRGDVVTSIPFQQVQTAIIQAVSPEFRHDISNSPRAHRVWTDMLILICWLALPLAALAAIVVPFLIPVLFGPGWELTGQLVPWLAIAAGLQMIATVLSSAIEILGRMKWIWSTIVTLIAIQLAGALALFVFQNLIVAMICLVVTQLVRHAINIWQCGRIGYLNVRRVNSGYLGAAVFSTVLAACTWVACAMLRESLATGQLQWGIGAALVVGAVAGLLVRFRAKLPPVQIASDYGIFRSSHTE